MDKVINKYVILKDENDYVTGFYTTLDNNYDYIGQMNDFPDATEGWMKFVPGWSQGEGTFVVDQAKKDEIIAEREAEARKPTDMDNLEAQVLWTALMTDTLIEENE